MVAPTRMPQARGVKCHLCKKILTLATWLDQTKLARHVEEAQNVLNLIKQHQKLECPCIPKNIENLLVGSTHFEIHRLVAKKLDLQIHEKQYEHFIDAKRKTQSDSTQKRNKIINDCYDTTRNSRFKLYIDCDDQKQCERSKQQLDHLCHAIDFWRSAMEDQANPFNSKLALRLGLTHHVIYACYLFKFYKLMDYQLITANLLLNLFKSIDGVTPNAILHANYVLIKTLIDCDQLQLARQYLKQAGKIPNYRDKSYYESILLTCSECELKLLEGEDIYSNFDELETLVKIKPDDKLQHYFARTLAMSLIIKYIHCYPSKSDHCYEFFHTFRYICAIIRRCYEDSFELVLAEKDPSKTSSKESDIKQAQILDHSWIRFAVCDFVYTTFDMLVEFHARAGIPEHLELLYNGLNLIAFRSGSYYWQSRMAVIGARLDLLCDKSDDATAKLNILTRINGYTNDFHLMNVLRLESDVGRLSVLDQEKSVISREVILDYLNRIRACKNSLIDRLSQIELYDCKLDTSYKMIHDNERKSNLIVLYNYLGKLSLTTFRVGICSLLKQGHDVEAKDLMNMLAESLDLFDRKVLEYYDTQILLEILIQFASLDNSEQFLLETINSSSLFLRVEDKLASLQSQLSSLTITGEHEKMVDSPLISTEQKRPATSTTNKSTRSRRVNKRTRRKGTYEVAVRAEETLNTIRLFDIKEAIKNFPSLSREELVASYLRNSEPNPDYSIYRRCHELMMCFRLLDVCPNHDLITYHFSESLNSNTMRYRWMMLEEQASSPYDTCNSSRGGDEINSSSTHLKHLGFCNTLVNQEKLLRSLTRTIPDEFKLIQVKYALDTSNRVEHIICCCLEGGGNCEPMYVHTRRPVASDDFFADAKEIESDFERFTIPNRLAQKVDESRKTLLSGNQKLRTGQRQQIETDIGVLLHDIDNDWLGPFRLLFCGKIDDINYSKFVANIMEELQTIMNNYSCNSMAAFRWFIENSALLNRQEFCQMMSILFNCPTTCDDIRECFHRWLKSFETYLTENGFGTNKTLYMQTLNRGQLGIALDNRLELIPIESLPIVRILKQGIFRVPSLRIFSILASRNVQPVRVRPSSTCFVLDPANNLAKTRERFDCKLSYHKDWFGAIGQAPKIDQLEQWLGEKDIYIFIGHGAGTAYYNKLNRGRGLGAMNHVSVASIIMGCSSGRMIAEGPRLETFGINWIFIFRGAPCYVGLLWDVTDTDIDRYLDSLLARWMPSRWPPIGSQNELSLIGSKKTGASSGSSYLSIAQASAQARHVCQLRFLVGSTPVVYGLPVWCYDH